MKKAALALGTAVLCLAVCPVCARAETAITGISLKIETEIEVGEACRLDDIIITPRGENYEVKSLDILNQIDRWEASTVPRIEVILKAEEDYYFSLTKSSIRLKGAEYEFGRRWDDNEDEYWLILRLPRVRDSNAEREAAASVWEGIGTLPEGITEPGQWEEVKALSYKDKYGWIQDGIRWWYRNPDGSWTANNWQLIDGKWYFFDSHGYMVTGWIDWEGKSYYCDPEGGQMLVSTVVPDGLGRRVDSTGAMIE